MKAFSVVFLILFVHIKRNEIYFESYYSWTNMSSGDYFVKNSRSGYSIFIDWVNLIRKIYWDIVLCCNTKIFYRGNNYLLYRTRYWGYASLLFWQHVSIFDIVSINSRKQFFNPCNCQCYLCGYKTPISSINIQCKNCRILLTKWLIESFWTQFEAVSTFSLVCVL